MDSLEEWLTQPEGLGTGLRALRVRAGLTGKQLADANGWEQSKVSRIENGKQMPSAADIEAWARTCGASDEETRDLLAKRDDARVWHVTFRGRLRQGHTGVQRTYTALAQAATLIRHFEMTYVPGPLQIPEYAECVFTGSADLHGMGAEDIAAAILERQERAQMLYRPGKQWEFLLAEPVLRWEFCPPEVMGPQLHRLQTAIGLPGVRFGIIPMGRRLKTAPQNTIEIYAGDDTVAVEETFIGETWHRGDEAARYERALDRLWKDAVEGEQARDLVIAAARSL